MQSPYLFKYKEWLNQQASSDFEKPDFAALTRDIESLVKRLEGTSIAQAARAIATVSSNIEALLKGEKTGFEVLNKNGNLDSLIGLLREQDDSKYLKCIEHSKANIGVVEIGTIS